MDKKPKTIVIIPTYNEARLIEKLISQIHCFQPEFSILIVDDNSPDGTGRLADELAKKSNKIKVLHRPQKDGLGRAYLEGFKYALAQSPPYERIIEMDADFSHSPKYLADLLKATEYRDFSLGSRYIPGGKIGDWDVKRRFLSYFANLYARLFLGLAVKDWTSGFRCFRREVLSNIKLESIKSKGYLFQIEVLKRCLYFGYNCAEVPITFIERKKGKTKLGFYEILEAVWGVPKICWFKDFLFNREK